MPLELFLFFFGGHLPQTSGFRSAKRILVVSFTTQARACILSGRNANPNAPGAFLVCVIVNFYIFISYLFTILTLILRRKPVVSIVSKTDPYKLELIQLWAPRFRIDNEFLTF